MVIYFNSFKARKQLTEKYEIITCRKQRKTFGITSAIYRRSDGNIFTIGKVNVVFLDESISNQRNHDEMFNKYIHLSGFDTVKEWKEEIKKLNNNRWMPISLIFLKVTLLE